MDGVEITVLILIILFVAAIIGWRVWAHVSKKRGAKPKSCCDCASCAASGACPSAKLAAPTDDDMPEITVLSDVSCDFDDLLE